MPKSLLKNSTSRRLDLAGFIDNFGTAMVQKCSTCIKHNCVCKVHVRSGRCNECNRRNQRCDAKVTRSEFRRLTEEKQKLGRSIDAALSAQADALEALRTARAREERLRQQMDLLETRASEAIAVESRAIEELEEEERRADAETLVPDSGVITGPQLSPSTWGALDGLDDNFWDSVGFPVVDSGGSPGLASKS